MTGEVAYETVMGIQSQGVQACAKHFINKYVSFQLSLIPSHPIPSNHLYPTHSEQEHFRESSSSNVDDKYVPLSLLFLVPSSSTITTQDGTIRRLGR